MSSSNERNDESTSDEQTEKELRYLSNLRIMGEQTLNQQSQTEPNAGLGGGAAGGGLNYFQPNINQNAGVGFATTFNSQQVSYVPGGMSTLNNEVPTSTIQGNQGMNYNSSSSATNNQMSYAGVPPFGSSHPPQYQPVDTTMHEMNQLSQPAESDMQNTSQSLNSIFSARIDEFVQREQAQIQREQSQSMQQTNGHGVSSQHDHAASLHTSSSETGTCILGSDTRVSGNISQFLASIDAQTKKRYPGMSNLSTEEMDKCPILALVRPPSSPVREDKQTKEPSAQHAEEQRICSFCNGVMKRYAAPFDKSHYCDVCEVSSTR